MATGPALTQDQNILPVQAYFNVDGSFNTFIGQGVPFVVSATESIGIIDTTVSGTFYPTFSAVNTGQVTSLSVSSTKLSFNPSTGVLTANGGFVGSLNGTASIATNLGGGGANTLVYQSSTGNTAYLTNGTTGQVLVANTGGAPTWSSASSSVAISDQTTSPSTFYPLFAAATSGSTSTVDTSSTKLQYVPSTGIFTATGFSGSGANLTSLTAGNLSGTIPSGVLGNSSLYIGTTVVPLNAASGSISSLSVNISGSAGSATTATTATNATNTAITDNTSSSSTWYPTIVSTTTGNLPQTTSSTKLSFVPSTGALSATGFVGSGGSLTFGTGSLSLAGNLTTLGAFTQTFTATANTSLTLPTSGYLISTVTNMAANPVTGTPSSSTYLRGDGTWATISAGSGTVTTVSVTSANGFAGSVSNPTTTPAITLSTSITGLLYGNGTALVAATISAPLSYSAGTLSITQATTSTNGYLSSTDWNTFNNKGNGTVTSVAALTLGTTGTDLSSSVANGTTTPVITLNVPTASASNRGALSSADWTTFNGKQTALVSGTNIKTVGGVSLLGSGDVGVIGATYGGTGVNNGSNTITLGGSLTTSGAFTTTLTVTANTSVTLPTTGTLATLAGTETLTNKRINLRVLSQTSTSTLAINSDSYDQAVLTAQAASLSISAPTGTPVNGQKLTIRIKDNGSAQTISWTTSSGGFRVVGTTLPTTTVASKIVYIGAIYNSDESYWDVTSLAQQV